MSLPFFTIARAGFGLYEAGAATGVIGWPDVAQALARIVPKMLAKAHKVDAGALDEMVALAKSRVPVDTGNLLNGITGEWLDDHCEFRASAVHSTGSQEDYARFVEFGTASGERGVTNSIVADEGFYSADPFSTSPFRGTRKIRDRKSARTHPGTPAQPYFYNSANEVLQKRNVQMADVVDQSASEEGWLR